MVKYYLNPFAISGDKAAIPDPTQISGSVSYVNGFGLDYQKNLATDPTAKPFPRAQFNELMYEVTLNLQQYQQHGVPEFITTADHGGTPYPYDKYAIVRYDDGVNGFRNYQSRVAANTDLPTVAASWTFLNPEAEQVPVGTVIDFAGTTAPAGYLACTGTVASPVNVSRTTYADLFAVIGTTWGAGDGSTTFGLPSLARRAKIGSGGTGSGTIGNTVGSTGGVETVTLVPATVPNLNVTVSTTVRNGASTPPGNVVCATGGIVGSIDSTGATTNGGGGAHENMPPEAVLLMCIKY